MNFGQLRRRVERTEQLVEGRQVETLSHWQSLRDAWKLGWTPPRIIIAGLVGGFITGKLQPERGRQVANQATRWIQMFSAVSGVFGAVQAQFAASQAEQAGDSAEAAADGAHAAAAAASEPAQSVPASAPAQVAIDEPAVAPRPAEAATEVSER